MNGLIIEDEFPAAERLKAILAKEAPHCHILASLPSVLEAVNWLQSHPMPDLIFSDIQLSDGLSFHIFEQVAVSSPIIFTTAYDEYAIRAFQLNSIDYLLKPIKPTDLRRALDKLGAMRNLLSQQQVQALLATIQEQLPRTKSYQRRFLVEGKDQWIPVEEAEIAYFLSAHEMVYVVRRDGRRWILNETLEQLEDLLDPARFFRANRQFLVQMSSIERISPYFNGRLQLRLLPDPGEATLVSREKARAFRRWMEGT